MNFSIRNLFIAVAGLSVAATAATAAPWPPAKGDLVLGVQALGSTTNLLYNLGPAHALRSNPTSVSLIINLNEALTAEFGANWATRNDLFFGAIANRNNAPATGITAGPEENGDLSSTIYATKGAGAPNTTPAWTGFNSTALGIAATSQIGFIEAVGSNNIVAVGGVAKLTQGSHPVQWNNGWSEWNPLALNPNGGPPNQPIVYQESAFSVFAGGIQRQFATAAGVSQVKMLDLYRIPGNTGNGTRVTTIYLADNGDLWIGQNFVTLTSSGTNGTVSGAGLFPTGATATLTAAPNAGYAFVNWTGAETGTSNPLNVTMSANKTVTANFALLPVINTPTFTAVTGTTATLGATVANLGDGTIVERGVVFAVENINANPLVGGPNVTKLMSGGTTGGFITPATGLTAGTTYAFKGFVTTSVGTSYTNVVFFTTDTTVAFPGGVGTVSNRAIRGGDSQLFKFNLTKASPVIFGGAGMTGQIAWQLFNGINLVDSGVGNVDFAGLLLAGDYSLRVTNNGAPTETFSLNLDASDEAKPKPDVSIGTTADASTGANVYSPAVQQALANSKRARPVTIFAKIDNDGLLQDSMKIQGTGGNKLFNVVYQSDFGLVSAAVIAGTQLTSVLADAAPVSVRVLITPNKKSKGIIKKTKRGKRTITTYLKKTFTGSLRATASSDASLSDTATFQVKTIP